MTDKPHGVVAGILSLISAGFSYLADVNAEHALSLTLTIASIIAAAVSAINGGPAACKRIKQWWLWLKSKLK